MFMHLEIAPIVLLVFAVILAFHTSIPASVVLLAVSIIASCIILTTGIIAYMAMRVKPGVRYDPRRYDQTGYTTHDALRASESQSAAIQPPREIHNHIHLDGMNGEQIAAMMRYVRRGDDDDGQ